MVEPDDIRRAREAKGLSQAALAALVGISQPAVRKIESGQTAHSRWLPKILQILGLDAPDPELSGWSADVIVNSKRMLIPFHSSESEIPILGAKTQLPEPLGSNPGFVLAGIAALYNKDPIEFVPRPWFLRRTKNGFGIIVSNEIMAPIYNPGDLVICDPSAPLIRGKNCVVMQLAGKSLQTMVAIARIEGWTADQWILTSVKSEKALEVPRAVWDFAVRIVAKVES